MKKILILLALLLFQVNLRAQVSFGKAVIFDDDWKFHLGDIQNAQSPDFDASKWRTLDIPHDWSVEGVLSPDLAACTGYLPGGIGWYRKAFKLSEEQKGEKIYIYFEGVYNRSEVFVNGKSVGKRPNGYVSFMYDITPFVEFDKENLITVRVDHSQYADSRWYTGSGIYRHTWLITANPVHIAQWGVFCKTKQANTNKAVLSIDTEIENGTEAAVNTTIEHQLLDASGKTVAKVSGKVDSPSGSNGKITREVQVNKPQLWSIDNPYLYTLKTTVYRNGKVIDQSTATVGIRTFTFDPDKGFALNGNWMKMKGVCIHHDAGVLGSAVPAEVWERRLNNLKTLGCNAIRMTHNPQAPELYDLCDKMGFLVMDEAFDEWEFAKRKWVQGWNVGIPGFQGSFDFFEEWGERDLADVIRRDRNHASIFAWSIGNEVDYPNDPYSHPVLDGSTINQPMFGGYKSGQPSADRLSSISKRLAATVRKFDTSRPVTAGLAGVIMSNATEYPGVLDIAGYNYTENRYDTDHKTYPRRIIYGSENRHELSAWKAVRDNGHIFGQFLWTGIDYLGESGVWPSRGFYTGLLDFGGFIKPRGYFRQSLWSDKPMAYLGTYPTPQKEKEPSMDAWNSWNYENGQKIRVVCYTNTAKVRLLLNGKEVGETKDHDDNTGVIFWDIPYQDGKLEVAGMDKEGNKICSYAIQSSKRPATLTLQAEKTVISKNNRLTQIVVRVVDENGIPVMLSDDEITCTIDGQAKLLGLEAGNNTDMGNYRDNVQRAYHGQLIAYIQATGTQGNTIVRFTSPWLKSAEIILNNNIPFLYLPEFSSRSGKIFFPEKVLLHTDRAKLSPGRKFCYIPMKICSDRGASFV